jgi:2,4-diaminopentanoate dehydrogenase
MQKLRVIQWATGKVGKLSLRGILDDPRLELAGVYAYSADKVGLDAGTLCGRPEVGITATDDLDALLALGADTVLFTPFTADLSQVVRLLESGLDVISTNLFLNLGGIRGEVRETLEAACRRGNSSLYVTGVNPGWINSVAAALTAVCRDVQCVTISESASCASYESVETWLAMGMSLPEATPEVIESARNWLILFRDSVERVTAALGFEPDDLEFSIEYATAAERIDLGWFVMEKDTNAAVRAGWDAKVGGRVVVSNRIAWYLTTKLNQGWTFDDDHYHVTIKGEPDVDTRIRFIAPEHWGNHEWDTITAMPAVNAVFDVHAAPPGVLGLKDVGLPLAPAGVWLGARQGG